MSNLEKQILDKLDHALLAARQSTPESLSPILQEIRNKTENNGVALREHIEIHEQDIKAIKIQLEQLSVSVQPAVSAIDTANNLKKGVTWIAGFIIAIGVLSGSIVLFKDWIKK